MLGSDSYGVVAAKERCDVRTECKDSDVPGARFAPMTLVSQEGVGDE